MCFNLYINYVSNYFLFIDNHPIYRDFDVKVLKSRSQTLYTHGRKLAAGTLSDRADVQFEFVVFRLGWVLKNMHTLYNYVSNSRTKDIAAAKGLAKWHSKSRGASATYLSIKTEKDKAYMFMRTLFGHHENVPMRVLYLLFGSLLTGYNKFVKILKSEPTGKFSDDLEKHPVINKLYQAMNMCNVLHDLFKIWVDEVTGRYIEDNYYGMPVNKVPNCKIDGRPLVEHMTESSRGQDNMRTRIVKLEHEVSKLRTENDEFSKYVRKEFSEQKHMLNGIAGTLTQLLGRNISEPPAKKTKLAQDQDSSSSASQEKPNPPQFLTSVQEKIDCYRRFTDVPI